MKKILATKKDVITDFVCALGESTYMILTSNYIRKASTRRGKDFAEIIGFTRTEMNTNIALVEWWRDFAANGYKINSKLGLRLFVISDGNKNIVWYGRTTIQAIENAKQEKENNGNSFERVAQIHEKDHHATKEEDMKDKIDCYLTIRGRLVKCQLKCSLNNSTVNI